MNEKAQALITMQNGALTPGNFEGLWRLSEIMAASGMMPKNIERPETVFVAVQMGLEVGLSPMQAVQNIAVVNGRPTIWGDAMLGLVRGSGLLTSISETTSGEGDSVTATCTVTRCNDPGETVGKFSVADAKRAGLWGKTGPWTQYPRRMLQMRARGYALRDKFPDVLKGLHAREEVEPEHYMGQVEVLSSAATLREIQSTTKPQEAASEPQEAAQGPASSEWPKDYRGSLYDSRGVVWDGVVHTGAKTCNSDGTWRRRKGVAPDTVAAAESRYPRIDPLTAFGSGPATQSGGTVITTYPPTYERDKAMPFDLAPTTGPGFADVLRWIETAQTTEELDEAMDAGKDVDLTSEQRNEIETAAATQAAIIERMQQS
jgi:hypothetical protein